MTKLALEKITRADVEKYGQVIVEAITGSQSFGLATPTSDVDYHGVYVLNEEQRILYNAPDEIGDEKNNTVYWELSKFLYLLNSANPQALELLYSPESCVKIGLALLRKIRSEMDFITMRCKDSFVEYARGQICRAKGLNKKIWNPQPEQRPRFVDFIYVLEGNLATPLMTWISVHYQGNPDDVQKWFSISKVDHADSIYALYYQPKPVLAASEKVPEHEWRWAYGVVRDVNKSDDVQCNSIPKGLTPVAHIFVNRNDFAKKCKLWHEYWDWVKRRNAERYNQTLQHGQGYDAKNMMHCMRLLHTAKDIATKNTVVVDRTTERDFLLGVKKGSHSYEEAMAYVENLSNEVIEAFKVSGLKSESYTMEELGQYLLSIHRWLKDNKSD